MIFGELPLGTAAPVASLLKSGQIKMKIMEDIIARPVAAVSLGLIKDQVLLDLNYQEDVKADSDCNLVGSNNNQIIELQCSAEQKPLNKTLVDNIYEVGRKRLDDILAVQSKELLKQCGIIFHW